MQEDFKDYYLGSSTPKEFLVHRLDGFNALLDKLNVFPPKDIECINTAVSCYLIHCTSDPNTKDKVVSAMNNVLGTAFCIARYSEEIAYFNSLLYTMREKIEDSDNAEILQQIPRTPYGDMLAKIKENEERVAELEKSMTPN